MEMSRSVESSVGCEIQTDSGLTLFEVEAPHLFSSEIREPVLFTDSMEPILKTCAMRSSLKGIIVVSYYGLLSMLCLRLYKKGIIIIPRLKF